MTFRLRSLASVLVLLLAGLGLAALTGCDAGGTSSSPTIRVAVIPKGTTHAFWDSIHAGALEGAAELKAESGLDVEIIWDGPVAENARDRQIQIVQSFVGQNIHGIVLAPLDAHALVGPVEQAAGAQKPVVIIDSGLKTEAYVSFVATDNRRGGEIAGEHVAKILGGKGKVLLLRYMVGSASTMNREEGFLAAIAKAGPDIEVVPGEGQEQHAGATAGEAQTVASSLLNAYTDIDAIFCPNESSAVGMLEALKASGRAGKVKFIGFDSSDKLLEGLDAGHIHGLVLQDPVRMGREGVKTLVKSIRKEKVQKRIDTGVTLVTSENRNDPAMQELLTPDLSILKGDG